MSVTALRRDAMVDKRHKPVGRGVRDMESYGIVTEAEHSSNAEPLFDVESDEPAVSDAREDHNS